jgi:hypothetical protein
VNRTLKNEFNCENKKFKNQFLLIKNYSKINIPPILGLKFTKSPPKNSCPSRAF